MTVELMGIYEVAKLCKVRPTAVCNWRKRMPDFPKPVADLHCGPIFYKADILHWVKSCTGMELDAT